MGKPEDERIRERPNMTVQAAAADFHDAAELLNGSARKGGNAEFHTFFVPTIVNAAFALELYLKSLNSDYVPAVWKDEETGTWGGIDEPGKWGHEPLILFDAIEVYIRAHLESEYLRAPVSDDLPTLRASLQACSGLYRRWRYFFQIKPPTQPRPPGREIGIAELFKLLDFLRRVTDGSIRLPPPPGAGPGCDD